MNQAVLDAKASKPLDNGAVEKIKVRCQPSPRSFAWLLFPLRWPLSRSYLSRIFLLFGWLWWWWWWLQAEHAYTWSTATNLYPTEPVGDFVQVSTAMHKKYSPYFSTCA